MKIRTKLKIIAALPFALALVIGFIIFSTSQQVHEAIKKERMSDAIVKEAFYLNTLTYEYLQHHEERAQTQWQMKHNSLKEIMTGVEFKRPAEWDSFDKIRQNYEDLGSLFSQLTTNYEKRKSGEVEIAVSQELEERIVGQLLVKSQAMVSYASQLHESSHTDVVSTQQKALLLIMVSIVILALLMGGASFLIGMGIEKPIKKLHEATEIIAGGNLDYEVNIKGRDEIGQLSRSFNEMTHKLKESLIALEEEIAERKQAEESLKQSEQKYRTLFEESKDVIFISTLDGRFLDINPAGVALFGYDSKEELLKVDIAKDSYLNPYDRKKFIQTMEQQGFVKDYELLKKRKDGEILTLLSTTTPSRDKEGKITEYHGIMRDVTQQRKLEQQLLHAQKMEAVGQLTGGIAHDFNNILTAIVGYSSLLQMKMSKDDPLRHNADQILASTERAANLVQSLLAFSRKQIMNLQPVKINEIVKRVEKLLLRIIGEDIEMKTILTGEDLTVMADSGQIEQVLMNLATNAKDAMPDGGLLMIETEHIEIDEEYIKTHGYGEPGMYALISVTDTGAGMDEQTRERIFEPFFTTKEVGKGTGLGLSMVYGIIKQHNGYINVYSEVGKGTTFKIYLPLTKKEVKEIKPTELAPLTGGTETILIAEDDADVRTFTKAVLEEFGYTVIEAVDGWDAINKFMENRDKIELLILDIVMPKKNGRGVYEEIKKTRPDIKVLFMSGYTANIIHKEGILEEGLDFVLKPISPTKLLRKIREVLDKD